MNFDLLTYADHETRIPGTMLSPAKNKRIFVKALVAWCTDFYLVAGFTMFTKFFIVENVKALFISPKLSKHLYHHVGDVLPALALSWFSYHFFSYFFNHGQTYGMQHQKLRLEVPYHSFKTSLKLAFKSLFFFPIWQSYKSHDYLYTELMAIKDEKAPELMTLLPDEEVPALPMDLAA